MQKLKIGVNMTVYIVDLDNNIIVPLSFDVANLAQFERDLIVLLIIRVRCFLMLFELVAGVGFEPTTFGL